MRKNLLFIFFLICSGLLYGQEFWKMNGIKPLPTICYGSHESHRSFVHPPAHYWEGLKSASQKSAKIEVTYVGFSPEAQNAFQHAVDIWKTLIYSPVPIRIKANWVTLGKDVLGQCGPTASYKNFNSTQIWNCYYPIALIEKMLGEEVNATTDFDIEASFNKDFKNWYLGTDGNTPDSQYDFVSTVMHELAHGLGFSGDFYSVSGKGAYGNGDGFAAVFDQYVMNKAGEKLVNTTLFPNPSAKLLQNLTSNWLEFNKRQADNSLPRLYAPTTWDDGSSIYHLDEIYPAGDPNSLMTYSMGTGEAIHDVGPITLSIMNEIGWKCVSMKHAQLKDMEFVSAPISFDVQIDSDHALDSTKLYLIYSTNKFVKKDSILLKATNKAAIFNAKLTQTQNAEIQYYFTATDATKKKYVFPSNAPSRYLKFKIGVDNEAPVLAHEPVKYLLDTNPTAKIEVSVSDNIGLKSVKLKYFVNGGTVQELVLKNAINDLYVGDLTFPVRTVKDGDLISYSIEAIDASTQSNMGSLPLSGYYKFYIEGFQKPVDKFITDFNGQSRDFISTTFSTSTVTGFDSPSLNSPHPYPSPDVDNGNFNLITILKYPIVLKAGGKMSFDEIVLVEPGESGTKYGDENFFDYVIVEGSKDDGITWKPLIDGYDSSAQKSWFDRFNKTMVGQNSTSVATKDLFVKREFELLANGNFKAGDIIQIRFRLFSDPYSHGWGWTIDNLKIQEFGTAINLMTVSSGEIILSPNPANDKVNLRIQTKNALRNLNLKVYNSSGNQVLNQLFSVESNVFQTDIDVSSFIPGLYLFALEPETGQAITRKILIQ